MKGKNKPGTFAPVYKKSSRGFNSPLTSGTFNRFDSGRMNGPKISGRDTGDFMSLTAQARLDKKAQAILDEASFIGFVDREARQHFWKLATYSEVGFAEVKEILRIQKANLVKRYDHLLSTGKIHSLDQAEYTMLYKAKYNVAPKHQPNQVIKLKQYDH